MTTRHTVKFIKLSLLAALLALVLVLLASDGNFLTQYVRTFVAFRHRNETGKITRQHHLMYRKPQRGDVLHDMDLRRHHVHRTCKALGKNSSISTLPRALVSIPRALVYCPVEKTASTFFRRFMYQLDHTDPVRSPFEVPVKMVYACTSLFTQLDKYDEQLKKRHHAWERRLEQQLNRRKKKRLLKRKPPTIEDFLQISTNFLFVRDPFRRLFSAYVDKLLAPNPVYWQNWGVVAIQRHRHQPSKLSLACGHDTTFGEFISFVLDYKEDVESMDPHLRPIYNLCNPCHVNYEVIGHMDTFERDAVYLSSLLNVSEAQLEFDKMAADSAKDAIEDSVTDAFTDWVDRVTKCISKLDMMKRIWRKLQIRGLVSVTVNFPGYINETAAASLETHEFIKIFKKALKLSSNRPKDHIQKQKEQAFQESYNTLNLDIVNRVVEMYDLDFRTFQFKSRPKLIFERSSELISINLSSALDLSKEWSMEFK